LQPLSQAQRLALERATTEAEGRVGEAETYLKTRGFDLPEVERFRLGVGTDGRLTIPAIGPQGVYSLRSRCILDHDHEHCQKYLGFEGVPVRLFNLRALQEAGDEIHITEGEVDAITLELCSLHAVGVPGVNSWKRHHHRLFAGFQRVFVWEDGDEAGRSFVRKVAADLQSAAVVSMDSPGSDANSAFVAGGPERILALLEESK
jgi:DNA primase